MKRVLETSVRRPRHRAAVLWVVCMALASAWHARTANAQSGGKGSEAQRLTEEGDALWLKNEIATACSKFRESLAVRPNAAAKAGIEKCVAAAESHFLLGDGLLGKNDFKNACAHFEQSMTLDPSAGTQANIALCLVKRDKNYPAACLAYREARRMNRGERDQARRAQREADIARDLKEIATYLPRLHIEMARPGLSVTVDGDPIDRTDLASPFLICPGERIVEATGPGLTPQSYSVRAAGTETAHLKVDLQPVSASQQVLQPAPSNIGNGQRIAGIVVGSTGLVAAGVTIAFAVDTVSKTNAFKAACPSACPPGSPGISLHDQALQNQNAAIVAGVASGALLGLGIVLYALAPSAPSGPIPKMVTVRVGPTGAVLSGQW